MTFPLNILVGIPLYTQVVLRHLWVVEHGGAQQFARRLSWTGGLGQPKPLSIK